ncbi:MAG: ATP-dependent sacrificial sulfur transferase LarE [Clostridia bacterium]|nr:ATP-dependent sacrificial sulfur transferase LarE [Clostridia bacterium]
MDAFLKKEKLMQSLRACGSLAVAFSGGVDSSFLLKCAFDSLGEKVLGVTARSSTYPEREMKEAAEFAALYGIPHVVIDSEELDIENYADNPPERCFFCKNELFSKIRRLADERGILQIAEGSNCDDLGDYRPGLRAASELGVLSPLREEELTKDEIRLLSKEMGLITWDKPSFACLASRVPYGEKITREKLAMIEKSEQFLLDLGFKQVRVRHHGNIARIELPAEEMPLALEDGNAALIYEKLKSFGFAYVSLDLKGYRTGSMNDVLKLPHGQ